MATLRLEDLRKCYGDTVAVDEVTLQIEAGEFVVFVGPSGCGKTTTLKTIAGLEKPTAGRIYIDEELANEKDPGERNLGMVFQNLALFPHMRVFDNIAFGLRIQKEPEERIRQKVRDVTKKVQIYHLLDKKPSQLSGGEAQRVALARTLVTDPAIFLLDEPLSNIDAKFRKELRTEIKQLHRLVKKTFLYVTHDQEEAMTLADRIIVMRQGRVEQVGTPLEIYNDPVNEFVAGFFGTPSMNFVKGTFNQRRENPCFQSKNLGVDLGSLDLGSFLGTEVKLGVRPEDIQIKSDSGNYEARITLTEPLGDETLLYLDYGGEEVLVTKVDDRFQPILQEGDKVYLDLNRNKLYFFGEEGKRIYPRERK